MVLAQRNCASSAAMLNDRQIAAYVPVGHSGVVKTLMEAGDNIS